MKVKPYSKYRETNIEWAPIIPATWDDNSVKFCFDIQLGKMLQPKQENINDIEYPYLKALHVNWDNINTDNLPKMFASENDIEKYEVIEGDLLVCEGGEVGRAAILNKINEPAIIQNALHRVRNHDLGDIYFFSYVLKNISDAGWFDILCNKATIAHLTGEKLGAIRFPVPPVKEQQKIAAFLDYKTQQIDQLIEKKKSLIEKLEEKRIALITQAVTKGLDKNAKLKPSGVDWLGDVPEHWDVKKLKFVGRAIMGLIYDPKNVVNEGEGHLVLRASNIQSGSMVNKDNVYIDMEIPKKLITRRDDVLICSRNGSRALIGKNALVGEEFEGCSFGAFTTIFRSDINDFLYFVFNSSLFSYQAGKYLTSTINQLTIGVINSFEVPVPDDQERNEIVSYLKDKLEKLNRSKKTTLTLIERLEEYRSAIITSAVTGKIDVRNVEVKEVTHGT